MNFTHQQHRLGKLTLHVVATLHQHCQWFVPSVKRSDVLHYAEIMLTLAAASSVHSNINLTSAHIAHTSHATVMGEARILIRQRLVNESSAVSHVALLDATSVSGAPCS